MGGEDGGAGGDDLALNVARWLLGEVSFHPVETFENQFGVRIDCCGSLTDSQGGDAEAGVDCVIQGGIAGVEVFAVAGFLGLHAVVGTGDGGEIAGVFEEDANIKELFGHLHDFTRFVIAPSEFHSGGGRGEGSELVAEQAFDGGQFDLDLAVGCQKRGADGQLDDVVRTILFHHHVQEHAILSARHKWVAEPEFEMAAVGQKFAPGGFAADIFLPAGEGGGLADLGDDAIHFLVEGGGNDVDVDGESGLWWNTPSSLAKRVFVPALVKKRVDMGGFRHRMISQNGGLFAISKSIV